MLERKESMPATIRILVAVVLLGLLLPLLLTVVPTRWHRLEVEQAGVGIASVWERYGRDGYVVTFKLHNRQPDAVKVHLSVGMKSFVASIPDPEVRVTETVEAGGVKRVRVPVWKPDALQHVRRPVMRDPSVTILSVEPAFE